MQLNDRELRLFNAGDHLHIYRLLGAHLKTVDGVDGVLFAVWAPNAAQVSVVGDFNAWDAHSHPMHVHSGRGVWELFIPQLSAGELYKFSILQQKNGHFHLKSDPYGQAFELRPNTASRVIAPSDYCWHDANWLQQRQQRDWLHQPLSIYELHPGAWQRQPDGTFLNYRELAHRLVAYLQPLGFTHVELMPVMEHPLDGSWGYQVTGFYAPTSRYGTADDFRYLVDYLHQHNISVLLDWVPGHFPRDAHGLAQFDGTALYEYADPHKSEHKDWGTLVFDYNRPEVKNFLIANALYWLEEFHIDGLRVDAVASMLYLDYSRKTGEWVPNKYGGHENLEAAAFMRELNIVTHQEQPGTLIMAEESTGWPQVTHPVYVGGLGFDIKWNMGWMHDTLQYFSKDPIYRHYHHNNLTTGLLYAFSENFMLPLSHDETVHGKHSLLNKMPGDSWQRFANLRLLLSWMWTYPGKKLLFMGNEFAQEPEWHHDKALDWPLLAIKPHRGIQQLVADLNRLYQAYPCLHQYDFEQRGFEWIDCNDSRQSILAFERCCEDDEMQIVLNFTPVPRYSYRIGMTHPGLYRVVFNSDSHYYAGSNVGDYEITADEIPWMDRAWSLLLNLPPLGAIVLHREM